MFVSYVYIERLTGPSIFMITTVKFPTRAKTDTRGMRRASYFEAEGRWRSCLILKDGSENVLVSPPLRFAWAEWNGNI